MNDYQNQRLGELKSKYWLKYVIWPGIQEMSVSMPFDLSGLKSASKTLRSM